MLITSFRLYGATHAGEGAAVEYAVHALIKKLSFAVTLPEQCMIGKAGKLAEEMPICGYESISMLKLLAEQ